MMLKKIGLAMLLFLLLASPVRAQSAAGDLAQQLICQCGCTMVLSNCTHGECSVGVPMKALIEQKLAQGQSGEEIIGFFVAQYGEQVLASPPKRGFNLVAWLLPFAAILAGGAVIYLALRAWVRRGEQVPPSAVTEEDTEKYQHQLEQELKEFSGGSFR